MADIDYIESLKREIAELRNSLTLKEELLRKHLQKTHVSYNGVLSSNEIVRYSRQMLVPSINLTGQILLKKSKVLIVGAGGLGCPAALYLVSSGVGELTVVDYDNVELSNLHRQVLHNESFIGMPKVNSVYNTLKSINSNVKINTLNVQISSKSIEDIIRCTKFSVVLDCSDNVPTRYLLNDVCVQNKIPLVSGSALQMDGQLTVYNFKGGPCYRCLFPNPPPNETVMNCGDAGVLGVVPGVIGVLQALEAIKIITDSNETLSGKFLVFDATDTSFRRIKLRGRNSDCQVCGDNPTLKTLVDYEQFCGSRISDKVENISILGSDQHIDIETFAATKHSNLVLDVRPEIEFTMCNLPDTVNFPYSKLEKQEGIDDLGTIFSQNLLDKKEKIYVLCRRGNDSQRAVVILKKIFPQLTQKFLNVTGGLYAYSNSVDSNFPVY